MTLTQTEPHWRQQSACADHDPKQFVSDSDDDKARARMICRGCPVLDRCRDWAMTNPAVGVWAAMTDEQRNAYRPVWLQEQRVKGEAALRRMREIPAD